MHLKRGSSMKLQVSGTDQCAFLLAFPVVVKATPRDIDAILKSYFSVTIASNSCSQVNKLVDIVYLLAVNLDFFQTFLELIIFQSSNYSVCDSAFPTGLLSCFTAFAESTFVDRETMFGWI